MADDLSEQLSLTAKLAAQVERLAAAAEKVEASYNNQISAVEKLSGLFGQIDAKGAADSVEGLNKALRDGAKNMKDMGKMSESNITKLGKKIKEVAEGISTKFPKSVAIAVAALSGLEQGIRNIVSVGKAVGGVIGGMVDWITNFSAAVISFPIKIFQGLFDMAVKSSGGSNELATAIEALRKQFGELYGPTNKAIIDTSKSLKGFADTGLSAWKVFGTLAQRFDLLRELATEMGAQFNKFHKEFEDNGGALLAYQKGLGLNNEQMGALSAKALVTGKSFGSMLKDVTKFSKALADSDTDAKLLSRDMGKMAKDVKHFGQLGTKELSEVALYARKLGIEVDKMTSTLDAFESFDSAAEHAAQLSQAFGANVDAFKLMEAQNPAEQFDILRKAMFAAGKTSENMSRQELKLLAQQTGMDEETAQRAFAMKNQGMSLDMIKKKSGEAEKKTLTQAEAMNKLADAIERMTPQGGGLGFTSFWDAFIKGFLGGIQQSKEFREIMINIQQSLRLVYQEGVKLGRAFVEMFPGVKDFLQGIADFFKPEKFKRLVGGVVDVLKDWMHALQDPNGDASFASLMDNLRKKFFDFFDVQSPLGQKLVNSFKTIMKTVLNLLGESIKWIVPKITEGLKSLVEIINNPQALLDSAGGAASAGKSMLMEMLQPLIKALNNPAMWSALGDAFKKFFVTVIDKIVLPALSATLEAMGPKVWAGLAAVMFGPAVGRAILGAAVKKMFSAVMEGVSSDAASGASGIGKFASMLANPYVLVAAAAVAITVGAIALAKTSMKSESEKLQDALDDENFLKKINDKNASFEERINTLKEERLKHAKKANDEAGMGILNFIRGGMSEHEADARAKMESIEKRLQEEKLKHDREMIVGTPEYQQKMAAAAAENKKRILDAMGPITVENAAERFKKVSDIAKKVMSKDFDLSEKMNAIRGKLDSVDFTLFKDKAKEDQVNQALSSLESIKALFAVISDVGILSGKAATSMKTININEINKSFDSLKAFGDAVVVGIVDPNFIGKMQVAATYAQSISVNATAMSNNLTSSFNALTDVTKSVKSFTKEMAAGGIAPALKAVNDMVEVANKLNTALSNGNVNKIDIKAKLGQVAKAVGLGGSATYTVNPSKEVAITVNMTVTMNAGEVERVILQRNGSVLRDRINFATSNPDTKATTEIPASPDVKTPKAMGGTKT